MATRLIQLQDGILVEADVSSDQATPIAGDLALRVGTTIDAICPLLMKIYRPIVESWKELNQELNQEMHIDQAEVDLGLSFEGEGNLYITKAKAGANLTVKLVLKPKG